MPIELPEAESDEAAAPDQRDRQRAESLAAEGSALVSLLLQTGLAGALYVWDVARLRYVGKGGRAVPNGIVLRELEAVRKVYRGRAEDAAARVIPYAAPVMYWARTFADDLRALHLTAGAIAQGGLGHLSPDDLREIGRATRFNYERLVLRANQVLTGEQKLDRTFMQRAVMQVDASRRTFEAVRQVVAKESGFEFEVNRLHPADHCAECEDLEGFGPVPVGTLPAPGDRQCLTNCQCTIEYLRAEDLQAA